MESTGVYWIPLYAGLEGEFDVKLAKKVRVRVRALEGVPLEEMVRILTGAGYLVQAPV
jgi:hypothetical protein